MIPIKVIDVRENPRNQYIWVDTLTEDDIVFALCIDPNKRIVFISINSIKIDEELK